MHELEKMVRQALAEDEETRDQEISVRVVGNVVFLDGLVESEAAKEKAEALAGAVEGVGLARNRLQVRKLRSEERREHFRH